MEQTGNIIRAQSEGSSGAALVSKTSLNVESLRQLGRMLQQMTAAFPHQEVPPETAEVFFATFETLAIQHGMKNLETALRSFLTRQKFFPHPSEVSEVLDEMEKKAKAGMLASLPKLGCELCHEKGWADGWVLVLDAGGNRRVKECECFLARARAKKGLEAKA